MAQKQCKVCGDYYDSKERVCPYCGDGASEKKILEREVSIKTNRKPKRVKKKGPNPIFIIMLSLSLFMGIAVLAFVTNVNTDYSEYESEIVEEAIVEEVIEQKEPVVEQIQVELLETEYVTIDIPYSQRFTYTPSSDNFVQIDFQSTGDENLEFNRDNETFYLYYNTDEFYYDISAYYDYSMEYFLDYDGYVYDDFYFDVTIANIDEFPDNELLINVLVPDEGLYSTKIFKMNMIDGEEYLTEVFTTDIFESIHIMDNGLIELSYDDEGEYYQMIDNDVLFIDYAEYYDSISELPMYISYPIDKITSNGETLNPALHDKVTLNTAFIDATPSYSMRIESNGINPINALLIYNGNFNSYDDFYANGRIKTFTLTFPDGSEELFELYEEDTSMYFYFDDKEVDYIDLTITELYPGESFEGFVISEIKGYYVPYE